MGRKVFVVTLLWMMLSFVYLNLTNASTPVKLSHDSLHNSHQNITVSQNTTTHSDTEASGSERNRRLIPYMAFYLAPTDLPINQQYALPTQIYTKNSSESKLRLTAMENAGPLPPPGYVAVPTSFLRFKPTETLSVNVGTPTYDTPVPQQNQLQQQQHSNQPRYRPPNHYDQYPVPISVKVPVAVSHQPLPLKHSGNAFIGVPILRSNKQKTSSVQHFPPLEDGQEVRQHQLKQPHRQRLQQNQNIFFTKVNFNPFTSTNTVPGHFVPIIYAPVDSDFNGDIVSSNIHSQNNQAIENNNSQNSNLGNYNNLPDKVSTSAQSQKYKQQNDYATSADYLSPVNEDPRFLKQNQQRPNQQPHQIKFIALTDVTRSPSNAYAGPSTHTGPVYHIVKESTPSTPLSSTSPQNQPHISQKPQQQLLAHNRPSKHPYFHPTEADGFFDVSQQRQQKQPLQEQYFYTNQLTPQEKYVLYLRHKMQNNKQREQAKQHATKDRENQYMVQYKPVPSSPNTTDTFENGGFIYSTTASAMSNEHENRNYLQHSPVHNAVYRSELSVPANHQPTQKPRQQVLHIPVQTILSEIDSLQKTMQPTSRPKQQIHQKIQHHQFSLPSQFEDNTVEPKKLLADDYSNTQQQPESPRPTASSPPQTAYIVITTAAPLHNHYVTSSPQQKPNFHLSTLRPSYQNTPTPRLQSLSMQAKKYADATRRPNNFIQTTPITQSPNRNVISKHYGIKYISTTPSYNEMMTSPTPTMRLKPSINNKSPAPTIAYAWPNFRNQGTSQTGERHRQQHHYHTQEQSTKLNDPNQLPDIRTSSLAEILHKLQASNHLPQTLTPDNIDNSIKTLITILNNLKHTQTIVPNPPQHHEEAPATTDYDYLNGNEDEQVNEDDFNLQSPSQPNKHPGPSNGRAGIDYPNYAEIPQTSFECAKQRYKGFFGDPETNCQVWHYCDLNGGKASFLCPNGTIFSQIALTCDWWFNVKCSTTSQLYVLNERLYKYILPFNKKFPEDYSGPLVDKYLAMKFQEMEEKMRQEKEKTTATMVIKVEKENNMEATLTTKASKVSGELHLQINEQSSEKNLLTDDIADDITQSGSFDTFESSTKQAITIPSESDNEDDSIAGTEPLSVRPIVVPSSTTEPNHSNELVSDEYDQNYLETKGEIDEHLSRQRSPKSQSDKEEKATKISIEKAEVIEIKSDGSSGHLTPQMFYRNL